MHPDLNNCIFAWLFIETIRNIYVFWCLSYFLWGILIQQKSRRSEVKKSNLWVGRYITFWGIPLNIPVSLCVCRNNSYPQWAPISTHHDATSSATAVGQLSESIVAMIVAIRYGHAETTWFHGSHRPTFSDSRPLRLTWLMTWPISELLLTLCYLTWEMPLVLCSIESFRYSIFSKQFFIPSGSKKCICMNNKRCNHMLHFSLILDVNSTTDIGQASTSHTVISMLQQSFQFSQHFTFPNNPNFATQNVSDNFSGHPSVYSNQ